jgi:hypothetical protein
VDLRSLPFPLLGSGTTSLIRQPSPSERHIYQCGYRVAILGIATQQLLRLASSPTQLTEREVKEAAMPGQPACARALPIFPRQFTLENRRSAASLAVIIVASPGRSYVFAAPTVRQIVARRNRKTFRACAETVDDGTSLWKAEENLGRDCSRPLLPFDFRLLLSLLLHP